MAKSKLNNIFSKEKLKIKLPKGVFKLEKLKLGRKFSRFLDSLKDYLLGILLMPWIWVVGFLTTISIFIWFYYSRASADVTRFGLPLVFNREINLKLLWYQVIGFVFLNYTISFFSQVKYPRLKFFFIFTSVFVLFLLAFITWPHVQQVLRS